MGMQKGGLDLFVCVRAPGAPEAFLMATWRVPASGVAPPSLSATASFLFIPGRQDTEASPSPPSPAARLPDTSHWRPFRGSSSLSWAWVVCLGPQVSGAGTGDSLCARSRPHRPPARPGDLTRPRVSAGIPAPALNMPVIFISLRQAAKAIPPAASAAATQCFPLVGRGNGGRPDFLITWC